MNDFVSLQNDLKSLTNNTHTHTKGSFLLAKNVRK